MLICDVRIRPRARRGPATHKVVATACLRPALEGLGPHPSPFEGTARLLEDLEDEGTQGCSAVDSNDNIWKMKVYSVSPIFVLKNKQTAAVQTK